MLSFWLVVGGAVHSLIPRTTLATIWTIRVLGGTPCDLLFCHSLWASICRVEHGIAPVVLRCGAECLIVYAMARDVAYGALKVFTARI